MIAQENPGRDGEETLGREKGPEAQTRREGPRSKNNVES